jgi:hypothetical protein
MKKERCWCGVGMKTAPGEIPMKLQLRRLKMLDVLSFV